MEVCPHKVEPGKAWKVTKEGTVYATYATQADAIALARALAAQTVARGDTVTLKIKRADGRIREERTWPRSSDPKRTKG